MTNRPERTLTEEEARALWERAARLQAEAATRRLPADRDEDQGDATEVGGLPLDAVRRAAMEAGIDPSFVDEALSELDESGPSRAVDRWADAYLGEDSPLARVTRIVEASIDDTYLALQRVLPRSPYSLVIKRVEGPDPRKGGVLVFEVPYSAGAVGGMQVSGPVMDIRHYADLKELRVRMRPVQVEGEDDTERTEIEVTASRTHARRVNYWVGQAVGASVGVGGALSSGLITAGLLTVGGPIEAIAMLGVGAVVGLGGLFGTGRAWRRVYRWGQDKGEAALARMLDAVDLDIHTGGAFSTGHQSPTEMGDGSDDPLGLGGLLGG